MTPRDQAFIGMVCATGRAQEAQARGDLVAAADHRTSVSDWRIALSLANHMTPALMDANGYAWSTK